MEKIEQYIDSYSGDLTRLCISLCTDLSDAEDLFQETWYKAIKYFSKYDEQKPFDKWLFSICVNTYKDSFKSSYKKRMFSFGSDKEKIQFFSSIPDAEQGSMEEFCELHKAVSDLPKKLKIVLTLFYFKDYSVKEISSVLKIPEGTVKSRLCSARKIIKRRLGK